MSNVVGETLRRKQEQVKDNLVSSEEVTVRRDELKALERQEHAEREKLAELKTVDPALAGDSQGRVQLKSSQINRDQVTSSTMHSESAGRGHGAHHLLRW